MVSIVMMIIYNVTIKVDNEIAEEWMQWMQEEHIPAILATGCFDSYKLVQLLELDDSDGPTYAIQYFADSMNDYKRYISEFATELRNDSVEKWGDSFIAFRSVMKVVA
jgi:hypothetical protein